MALDPELEATLGVGAGKHTTSIRDFSIEQLRRFSDEQALLTDSQPPQVERVRLLSIPLSSGSYDARLYEMDARHEPSGLLVWVHGGGFVVGSLDGYDAAYRRLCAGSGMAVLGITYSLAPEHPFPAGFDDVVESIAWVQEHADQFGVSASNIIIGGDSAGALLALEAALVRAKAQRPLRGLVLAYPTAGPEIKTASMHDMADGYLLSADAMNFCYELYLAGVDNHADPRISPLLSLDLPQAPPTVLSVAGFDPLHDEGLALCGLLEGAGVAVTFLSEPEMIHGYLTLGGISQGARSAIGRLCDGITAILSTAI
jgi:acetyl esterase